MTSTSIVEAFATPTIEEVMTTHTVIEVEHDAGNFVQQQSNTLFIWVLTVFITMYILLSTCYRQLSKRRVRIKKNIIQPDEISLVTSNLKES